jgi:hypothetical protein
MLRWEDNIKIELNNSDMRVSTGHIWLRLWLGERDLL